MLTIKCARCGAKVFRWGEKLWHLRNERIVVHEGSDATGIDTVEFYVDGDLMHTADSAPFVWTWDSFVIGYRTLELVATDRLGHATTEKMTVLRFNV